MVVRLVRMAPQDARAARHRDSANPWARTWVAHVVLLSLPIGAVLAKVLADAGCAFDGAGAKAEDRRVDVAEDQNLKGTPTTGVHGLSERREESNYSLGGYRER